MARILLSLAFVLLAGCARSEEANLLPPDVNGARSVEMVRPERDDDAPALGEWRSTLQDDQRALEFGPNGAAPLFSFGCDDRHNLVLQRNGVEPTGDLPVMLIAIGTDTRRLAVTRGEGPIPLLRASLAATDPLAALLSRAPASIQIRIGDSPPLILPPSPAIGGYVSQCESGALTAPRLAAPANVGSNILVTANSIGGD